MDRKITDKYRADIQMNTVAPLPDILKPMSDDIHKLIQSVYDESILEMYFLEFSKKYSIFSHSAL